MHNKIKTILETFERVALFGHMHPDGDCIGAMLGLGALLEKQGKQCVYFVPDAPSKIFDFLPGTKKLKTSFDYGKYDVLVFVDFSEYSRIPSFTQGHEEYFDEHELVIIDHHPGEFPRHALTIRDEHCMSTAELVFENTYKWRPKLFDEKIATYLYMGLTTDSGNFLYDEDHERTLSNALGLVKLGANKNLIVNELIRKKSLNLIQFTQVLLKRIKQKGGLLYVYYSDVDLKKYGVDQEEAHYPLHIIQNIDGPKLVLLLRKIDGFLRGSLRSKKTKGRTSVDCNIIAQAFGGGGHKAASGFSLTLKGKLDQQITKLTNKIAKMIK